jgi:branched-chain amino acid transport system permease protein
MTDAAQFVVGGLATGSLYALVALGVVLLYRSSRVLNFAHGDVAAVAAFVALFFMMGGFSFSVAIAGGLAAVAVLGAGFYFSVVRPAKTATLLSKVVFTLGLALVLSGLMQVTWGTHTQVFPFPLSDTRVYHVGPVVLSEMRVGTIAISLALMAALYVLVQHTKVGLAMRAVAQNPDAAQALGIPARRIHALTWATASALGGAAGILIAPVVFLDPFMMLDPFLKGFAAAVLGGMDSPPGAVLGGFTLGIAGSLFAGYVSFKYETTMVFGLILLVLLIRPEGILGREYHRRA